MRIDDTVKISNSSLYKYAVSLLTLIVYVLPVWASDTYYDDVIEIQAGQSSIINYDNVTRISVGNGDIIEAKILKDTQQILLLGNMSGITDLRVWENTSMQKHFLIRVNSGVEINKNELLKHVGDIPEININESGNDLIITGSGLRESHVQRIATLSQQYKNIKNYVSGADLLPSKMIHMDVKVVEIKKSELKDIGINWSDVVNGPQYALINDYNTNSVYRPEPGFELNGSSSLPLNAGTHNPYFGISTNLTSLVNLMANDGIARMLAEPQLSCRSGGKAEFLAGGEVPLPVKDKDGTTNVTFKKYGIILKMEPVSSDDALISTHVSVEISTIDNSLKVQDIPGFLTRKTETDMNVKEGETMVISGLVNTESAKAVDKLPGLGNIPIIGELFKSRSFRKNETELVILVTPHIINPQHHINKTWINRAKRIEDTTDNDIGFSLLD